MAWRKILGVDYGLNHGRLVFVSFSRVMCGFVTGLDSVHLQKLTICRNHHRDLDFRLRDISVALLDSLQHLPKEPLLEDLPFLTILTDLQNNPKQM